MAAVRLTPTLYSLLFPVTVPCRGHTHTHTSASLQVLLYSDNEARACFLR